MGDEKKEKHYTGVVPLSAALNAVDFSSKSTKVHVARPNYQRDRFKKIFSWMRMYKNNFTIEDGEITSVTGKIMPSVRELEEKFGMTAGDFFKLAKKYGDRGGITRIKPDLEEERRKAFAKKCFLVEGEKYVVLESLYPFLFKEKT
jgi:hypothetical protein